MDMIKSIIRGFLRAYRLSSELPSGFQERHRWIGIGLYVFMCIVAVLMLITIAMSKPVVIDVDERRSVSDEHGIPDIIMCPMTPTQPKTTYKNNPTAAKGHSAFTRTYKVWFHRLNLEAVNITDDQLDQLAEWAKTGHMSAVHRQQLLGNPTVSMLTAYQENPEWRQSQLLDYYFEETTNHDYVEALWIFLTLMSDYELKIIQNQRSTRKLTVDRRFPSLSFKCWPSGGFRGHRSVTNTGGGGNLWCHDSLKIVWIENSRCFLFENVIDDERLLLDFSMFTVYFPYFTWNEPYVADAFGIEEWIGNFRMHQIKSNDFWPMFLENAPDSCFAFNSYDALKIIKQDSPAMSVCQESDLFQYSDRARAHTCVRVPVTEYWTYRIKLDYGCHQVPWYYVKEIMQVTEKSQYTSIQRIQIYGGAIGFATGLSVLQIFEVLTRASFKNKNMLQLARVIESSLTMLFFVVSIYFAAINIQDLTSEESRYSRSFTYGRVGPANSLHAHVQLFGYACDNCPHFMFNKTTLARHNVSPALLSYITSVTGYTPYNAEVFSSDKKIRSIAVQSIYKSATKNRFLKRFSHQELSDLADEMSELSERLNLAKDSPPFMVYNALRIDLCILILKCSGNGVFIDDCCKFARYETMYNAAIDDSIYLALPKVLELQKISESNSLIVQFDAKTFKETNYVYLGAEYVTKVHSEGYTRASKNAALNDEAKVQFRVLAVSQIENEGELAFSIRIGHDNQLTHRILETGGARMTASLSMKRVTRLEENKRNNCRPPTSKCRVMSTYKQSLGDIAAHVLVQKTLCGCQICQSKDANKYIRKMFGTNGNLCCSASQAANCLLIKTPCCGMNKCCSKYSDASEISSDRYRCVNLTNIQDVFINHRFMTFQNCDFEKEVFNATVVSLGSKIAAAVSEQQREEYTLYKAECDKPICDQTVLQNDRADITYNNTGDDAENVFELRLYLDDSSIFTFIENDRFNLMEAAAQLMAGIGILIGISVVTALELFVALGHALFKILARDDDASGDAKTTMKSVSAILNHRLKRAITVFQRTKIKPDEDTATSDKHGGEDTTGQMYIEEENTTAEFAKMLFSVLFVLSVGYFAFTASMSIVQSVIWPDHPIAAYQQIFSGQYTPPSIAICAPKNSNDLVKNKVIMRRLIDDAQCIEGNATVQHSCGEDFSNVVDSDVVLCFVYDRSNKERAHDASSGLRSLDFNLTILEKTTGEGEARHGAMQVWFGDLEAAKEGFAPLESWRDLEDLLIFYGVTQIRSEIGCSEEEVCNWNKFDSDKVKRVPARGATRSLVLYDWYGMVDQLTTKRSHTWPILIATAGGLIDMFLGVTILSTCSLLVYLAAKLLASEADT